MSHVLGLLLAGCWRPLLCALTHDSSRGTAHERPLATATERERRPEGRDATCVCPGDACEAPAESARAPRERGRGRGMGGGWGGGSHVLRGALWGTTTLTSRQGTAVTSHRRTVTGVRVAAPHHVPQQTPCIMHAKVQRAKTAPPSHQRAHAVGASEPFVCGELTLEVSCVELPREPLGP